MKNKDNTSKVETAIVAQIFFAILAIVLCGCLVYGYSGVYISDSTSDILIKIMTTGSVVLIYRLCIFGDYCKKQNSMDMGCCCWVTYCDFVISYT